jgi:hypothetical protein
MAFTFDEKEAGSGFEALPISEYECVITDIKESVAQSGNEMLTLTLTVRDDVDQPGHKRKFFDYLVFTEKAMFKVHQVLKAVGTEQGQQFDTNMDIARHLIHKPIRVKNKHETYEGEKRDKIAFYKPSQASGDFEVPEGDPFSSSTTISDEDLPF